MSTMLRPAVRAVFLITLAMAAIPATAVEISPTSLDRSAAIDDATRGRFSERTLAVAIEVDREGARVMAYVLKARPYLAPLEIEAPRAYLEDRPLQLEVALLGPGDRRHTRRVDLAGLCLAHPPGDDPHVAGDTIRLHRESFVVELPERVGMDRVEIAYYEQESGLPLRRSLGIGDLDAGSFRSGGGAARYADLAFAREEQSGDVESVTASTALWPEDFQDDDIYQVFGSEAEASRRINVVIVPDGYTYAEKSVMETHANDMVSYFRATRPYTEHDPFMNYILVYAYSVESGTDQCDCGIVLDTAMGTRFPSPNPSCGHSDNRCLYYDLPQNPVCDTSGASNIVEAELRAPAHDTTIVMVNTSRYGGCGGARGVYSAGNSSATDIAVHELGHSLAGLADEYQGAASCGFSAGEVNTSRDGDVGAWPEWVAELGGPFEGAQYYNQCIYRPLPSCEMRSLFQPFCPVCKQRWSLLTFGHPRVSPTAPIESSSPSSPLAVALWEQVEFSVAPRFSTGQNVTNEITWKLGVPGGTPAPVATGSPTHTQSFATEGLNTVEAEIVADTNFVKPAKYGANRDVAVWQVQVTAAVPPSEVSPPGTVDPVVFVGPNRIAWEPASSSGSAAFNVYSGAVSALASGYGSCQQSGVLGNEAIVFGQPTAGTARFYLVTGTNSAGEGTLGLDSSGATRNNGAPCN